MKEYYLEDDIMDGKIIYMKFQYKRMERLFIEVWNSIGEQDKEEIRNNLVDFCDEDYGWFGEKEIAGVYDRTFRKININYRRLLDLCWNDKKIKYCIAHELGHALYASINENDEQGLMEDQANTFALWITELIPEYNKKHSKQ
jgi:hypothetical protein